MRRALGLAYANRLAITLLPPPPRALLPREVLPWLFVAGCDLPEAPAVQALGEILDPLIELNLLQRRSGQVAATLSILPIGRNLVCCDLPGSPWHRLTVPGPDLSAYHVIRALRQRAADSWLDVGTGSGAVLLGGWRSRARIGQMLGTDVNPRALEFAQLGAALSGLSELSWRCGDLFEGVGEHRWRIVTFNPPLDLEAEADESDDELPRFSPVALV